MGKNEIEEISNGVFTSKNLKIYISIIEILLVRMGLKSSQIEFLPVKIQILDIHNSIFSIKNLIKRSLIELLQLRIPIFVFNNSIIDISKCCFFKLVTMTFLPVDIPIREFKNVILDLPIMKRGKHAH